MKVANILVLCYLAMMAIWYIVYMLIMLFLGAISFLYEVCCKGVRARTKSISEYLKLLNKGTKTYNNYHKQLIDIEQTILCLKSAEKKGVN